MRRRYPYRNPFLEKKKEHIREMLNIIRKNSPIKYAKLIATYEFDTGVGRETAREHLKVLEGMGKIVIENGFVRIKEGNGRDKG